MVFSEGACNATFCPPWSSAVLPCCLPTKRWHLTPFLLNLDGLRGPCVADAIWPKGHPAEGSPRDFPSRVEAGRAAPTPSAWNVLLWLLPPGTQPPCWEEPRLHGEAARRHAG